MQTEHVVLETKKNDTMMNTKNVSMEQDEENIPYY